MTKLIVVFRNFSKAPEKTEKTVLCAIHHGKKVRFGNPSISRAMGDRGIRVRFWTESFLFSIISRLTACPRRQTENSPTTKVDDL
jgi:hypothetical protein